MQHKQVDFFVGSDFHLECQINKKQFEPSLVMPRIDKNNDSYNVCLLAGDITRPTKQYRYTKWFERFCAEFDLVFYVEGNHEHWGGNFGRNFEKLQTACSHIENLRFMRQGVEAFVVAGKEFTVVAATLWSDLSGVSDYELERLSRSGNGWCGKAIVRDFSNIRFPLAGQYLRMKPHNYHSLHIKDKKFIQSQAEKLQKAQSVNILMTHHSPTLKSLVGFDAYEYFDATDLEYLLFDTFDLCAHGHIHREGQFESKVGRCKIVSNPSGYEGFNVLGGYKLEPVFSVSVN